MSRDNIVFDTAIFVAAFVMLALLLVFGNTLAEISGWSQSQIDYLGLAVEAVMMLLVFAFAYRAQNWIRELSWPLGEREVAVFNLVPAATFVFSQWRFPMDEPLLRIFVAFSVVLVYNAMYPLVWPIVEEWLAELIVALNDDMPELPDESGDSE